MMMPIYEPILTAAWIFCLSILGMMWHRKNIIMLLMCIELMLLAVNTNFITFAYYADDLAGQIFVFFILAVAAAEAAIGLALVLLLFRNRGTIDIDQLTQLKG